MKFNKLENEKIYNNQKIIDTTYAIYDWQFKRFKNRVERERYRNEYDAIKSKLELLEKNIKTQKEKPTMPEGDIKRLDDDKVRMESDAEKYKQNMDNCDKELNGVQEHYQMNEKGELMRDEKGMPIFVPSQPGIEQMLEALRDLREVYKAYGKIVK